MLLEKKKIVRKTHQAEQPQNLNPNEISEQSSCEVSNCHSSKPCMTTLSASSAMQKLQREALNFCQFKVVIEKFDQDLYKLNKFNVKIKSSNDSIKIVSPCKVNDQNSALPTLVSSLNNQIFMQDEQEQNFGSSFRLFILSRLQNSEGRKIDVSYCTLNQLIRYCKEENIMNDKTYNRFQLNNPPNVEKIFIDQFQFQTKMVLNFKFQLFALIDHRLFSQVLCCNNPQKYFKSLEHPVVYDKQAMRFLKKMYSMPYSKYTEQLQNFNEKYERFWMPTPDTDLSNFRFDVIICDEIDFNKTRKNGRFLRERNNKNLMEDQSQI